MIVILAAIVIGLSLGLFGSGGSILTVPVLLYLLNMPAQVAIASSLLIVAGISAFGSIQNAFKQLISWRHVIWFGLPGMLGTYAGAWIGTLVEPVWQLLLFSALMLVAAFFMWRHQAQPETNSHRLQPVRIGIDGLVVGAITGFVGVGGGFLIVPALVLLGGLNMPLAVGTSLVVITLKSVVGFSKYYSVLVSQGNTFDWSSIVIIILAGIAGSYIGKAIGQHLPVRLMQKGFAIFLVGMAMLVIYQTAVTA